MLKPNQIPSAQRRLKQWLRNRKARGVNLYEGPSLMPGLEQGAPVRHLLSLNSDNTKLGGLAQTWHLRADMHPLQARRGGAGDKCICGDCPFRARKGQLIGACYPNGVALNGIQKSYDRGNYPSAAEIADDLRVLGRRLKVPELLTVLGSLGNGVRLGAYGDPVCMPAHLAQALVKRSGVRQGFTHQWRAVKDPWRRLLMASCELPEQVGQAAAQGWRTYTAYPPELTERQARQAIANASAGRLILAHCPASALKGYAVSCETCPIQCNGVERGRPWHVLNAVHGAPSVMSRYKGLGYLEQWRAWL